MTTGPDVRGAAGLTVAALVATGVFDAAEWVVPLDDASGGRIVTGVTITPPPFDEFARDGEIVVCIGTDLDSEDPHSIHAELDDIGVAALVLSFEDTGDEGRWRQDWPRPASVPLVLYPWERRFADLARAVDDAIALHEQDGLFVEMAHQGRSVEDILDALENALRVPVLLLDHSGLPVGRGKTPFGYDEDTYRLLSAATESSPALPSAMTAIEYPGGPLPAGTIIGIAARQDPYAYLHVSMKLPLNRVTRQRLADAAAAVAIEALRRRSTRKSERLLAEAALWSFAQASNPTLGDDEYRRLIVWGLSPARLHYVAAGAPAAAVTATEFQQAISLVRNTCADRYPTSLVAAGPGAVLLVLPVELTSDAEIVELTRDVLAWGVPLHAVELRTLPEMARTTLRTARAALLHRGVGTVSTPAELRAWLMIVDIADNEQARDQADQMIAALDTAGGDLVATLRVLLEENCNASAAARRMYLNRHSLLYRIERIEQLTETSLHSHTDRLMLQLCLIVHDINSAPPA